MALNRLGSVWAVGSLVAVGLGMALASCSSDGTESGSGHAGSAGSSEGGEAGESAAAGSGGSGAHAGAGVQAGAGGAGESGAGGDDADGGAAGAGAGGDGEELSDELTDLYLSGTRLRARLDVAGSAKVFLGWHDSTLNADCDFARDTSGTLRCLPVDEGTVIRYSDDKCQTPVVLTPAGLPVAKFVTDPAYQFDCSVAAGPHIVAVGAALTPANLWSKESGACAAQSEPRAAGDHVNAFGATVPDTSFVGSKMVREKRDSRLDARVIVATDGARQVSSFYDVKRNFACSPLITEGDAQACVPSPAATVFSQFADSKCTVALANFTVAHGCAPVTPGIVHNASGYFEVGGPLFGSAFTKNNGMCQPFVPQSDVDTKFYGVGAPVPFSSLPAIAASNEGAGRVQLATLRGPGKERLYVGGFFDTTFKSKCSAQLGEDQVRRCIADDFKSTEVFSDAACSQALHVGFLESTSPTGSLLQATFVNGSKGFFQIGAKVAANTPTFRALGGACQSTATPGADLYATTPVPLSGLVTVTSQIE